MRKKRIPSGLLQKKDQYTLVSNFGFEKKASKNLFFFSSRNVAENLINS